MFKKLALVLFVQVTFLVACNAASEPPPTEPCELSTQGITLLPTAEPVTDPDLSGENPRDYLYDDPCGLDLEEPTPVPDEPAISTGDVRNVTLDSHDAQVESVAASAHMTAVAWTDAGDIYVGISRGQGGFEVARVDSGTNPDLAISGVNRLHLVYEQEGTILYRVADGNTHPADTAVLFSTFGSDPEIEVDLSNWAHIVFVGLGGPEHIVHLGADYWFPVQLPAADTFTLTSTGESLQLLLTTAGEVQVHSMYFTDAPVYQWTLRAAWPIEGELQGKANLAYNKPAGVVDYYDYDGDEPYWMAASWVERFEDTTPPEIDTLIPIYEIVNPLYPDQLANPDQIYDGLNATRWHGNIDPYDAGLQQTISVDSSSLTIQAQVKVIADTNANPQMQIGIDPNGGTDPSSPDVIWSAPLAGPSDFMPISVSANIPGGTATLFLRTSQDVPGAAAVAIWDAVTVITGEADIQNPSFEGAFHTQGVVENIPDGWAAFYNDTYTSDIDSGATIRDTYRVYGAWSEDRGVTWSEKQEITENTDLAAGTIGALRPMAYPAITTRTEPDSIAFFYIYESGDPPANTSFLRYGRPYVTRCEAGTTNCTDTPGEPIFPRDLVRPTINLAAVQDHTSHDQVVLVWDALQADYESKDIHMTILSLTD